MKIGNYRIDGWHEETKTVFEFHGCVFHGCPKCYSPNTYNSLKNELMSQTYSKHVERINRIKTSMMVNKVIEIWECEFDLLCKVNDELKTFVAREKDMRYQVKAWKKLENQIFKKLKILTHFSNK